MYVIQCCAGTVLSDNHMCLGWHLDLHHHYLVEVASENRALYLLRYEMAIWVILYST